MRASQRWILVNSLFNYYLLHICIYINIFCIYIHYTSRYHSLRRVSACSQIWHWPAQPPRIGDPSCLFLGHAFTYTPTYIYTHVYACKYIYIVIYAGIHVTGTSDLLALWRHFLPIKTSKAERSVECRFGKEEGRKKKRSTQGQRNWNARASGWLLLLSHHKSLARLIGINKLGITHTGYSSTLMDDRLSRAPRHPI